MRKNLQGILMPLLVLLCSSVVVTAQQHKPVRRHPVSLKPQTDTTKRQLVLSREDSSIRARYGNVPIVKAPPEEGGFNDLPKKTKRADGFIQSPNQLIPLPYDDIRKDDILYCERVWREIDTREKINLPFRYKENADDGDQRFINILVNAVRSGEVTAFDPGDDRFTTPLDSAAFEKTLTGFTGCDTVPVFNPYKPDKIDSFVVVCDYLRPDDIVKYRIKEDWIFDRESGRMIVRILGIAPLKTIWSTDKKTERGTVPLFWLYYPDLRPTLVNHDAYNPKNMHPGRMTWEEVFESRMFGSYIVKSSLDNPQNKAIRQLYPGPQQGILRLLEGENIQEKIFKYEQGLWSY